MPHREIKSPKRFPSSGKEFAVVSQQDGHVVPPEATYDGDVDDFDFDFVNKRRY